MKEFISDDWVQQLVPGGWDSPKNVCYIILQGMPTGLLQEKWKSKMILSLFFLCELTWTGKILYILHKKWEELIEKAYRQEFSNNLGEKSRSVKSCTHGALFDILKDVLCKLFFLPDTKLSLEELDFQACFSFGVSLFRTNASWNFSTFHYDTDGRSEPLAPHKQPSCLKYLCHFQICTAFADNSWNCFINARCSVLFGCNQAHCTQSTFSGKIPFLYST